MEKVCPGCASSVELPAPGLASTCPRCGADWAGEAADPCASDPALAQLSAELRQAFGAGAFGVGEARQASAGSEATLLLRSAGRTRAADVAGTRLGDFELIDTLGRGGMGVVYRARQLSLSREVALKVLPPFARRQRAAVARFRRESQAAARLHHTNIVPIYAQGEQDDRFYYAMELIDGEGLDTALRDDSSVASLTLRPSPKHGGGAAAAPSGRSADPDEREGPLDITRISRGRNDYHRIARLLAEVADALDHAHQSGVIHRDIKPQNLLLGRDGRLHVTDFGLAHLVDQPHLTVTGEIMGTPAYMSPEQVSAESDRIDARTDIYSLGVTLYELLTLRRPFEGHTREQVMTRIAASEPRSPRLADARIPRDLETICLRAIEKEPSRRYPSAGEMAADLRRFAEEMPIRTRRATPLGKAIKWVRRHRALSAAIGACAAVVVLLLVLAGSAARSRAREADGLIASAYDRLVYLDYRQPAPASAELDRAEQLGGDPARIGRLRGLAAIAGPRGKEESLAHFEAALGLHPDDLEGLYLKAWAEWRAEKKAEFADTFERAESLGGPRSPAEWLFRGLAVNFHQPAEAIACFERARDLRKLTQNNQVFPQATLHLARARNQQMYRSRDITTFEPVKRALEELIENKYYGVYPYYLLSISHRLVAEVYADSEGTRGENAERHFASALERARQGQALPEVSVERAITAEAECLESMGDFAGALEARTRALAIAETDSTRGEAVHYRWRLKFWMGDLEGALLDLGAHCRYAPELRAHAHFYPMLVLAQAGRMEEALAHARAIAEDTPESAVAVLESVAALRLLGRGEEADRLLTGRAGMVDYSRRLFPPQSEAWVRKLFDFEGGSARLEDLVALAEEVDSHWKLTGEAYFHAGILSLGRGDRDRAQDFLSLAYRSFDDQTRYTYLAQLLRVKWKQDPSWPPWLPHADAENNANSGS